MKRFEVDKIARYAWVIYDTKGKCMGHLSHGTGRTYYFVFPPGKWVEGEYSSMQAAFGAFALLYLRT